MTAPYYDIWTKETDEIAQQQYLQELARWCGNTQTMWASEGIGAAFGVRRQLVEQQRAAQEQHMREQLNEMARIKDTRRAKRLAEEQAYKAKLDTLLFDYCNEQGGSNVNNVQSIGVQSAGQLQQRSYVESLIYQEVELVARAAAYERHSIPVPDDITKRLAALSSEIAVAWRAELDRRIAAREQEISELRSQAEKKADAEGELEKLKVLRDAAVAAK